MRPQASEGEAQLGLFCWTGRIGQGLEYPLVDATGMIVREVKVASEHAALLALRYTPYNSKRIGLEAGRCCNGCSVQV